MRKVQCLMGLVLAGGTMVSIGCESDHKERTHTSSGDVVIDHDRDRVSDIHDASRDIPSTAREVRSVSGRDAITFRPDHSGMLYVYDSDDRRLIWSGHVDRDQSFTLDPTGNNVGLDGHRLTDRDMNPRHTYKLYFDEGAR